MEIITLDQELEMIRLNVDEKISKATIRKMFNISKRRINEIFNKNQVPKNWKISDEQKQLILDLYSSGLCLNEVSRRLNIGSDSVKDWLRFNKISIRQDGLHRIYSLNDEFFDRIDSASKAYTLGFWDSDGCNMEKTGKISIHLQLRDKGILEKIAKEMNYNGPIRTFQQKPINKNLQDVAILCLTSRKLSNSLTKLGCTSRKSLTLEFPTEEQVPRRFMSDYVRGIFDGDGCIHWKRIISPCGYISHRIVVTLTSSTKFCIGLIDFLQKELGIKAYLTHKGNHKPETSVVYIQSRVNVIPFMKWMYNDSKIHLDRKYNHFQDLLRSLEEKDKTPRIKVSHNEFSSV